MFCRKCGKEIPDDSEFCPKCGTAVGNEILKQMVLPKSAEEISGAVTLIPDKRSVSPEEQFAEFMMSGQALLDCGSFSEADKMFERALIIKPEAASAHIGRLLAELKLKKESDLDECVSEFYKSSNFLNAEKYADDETAERLNNYRKNAEKGRIEAKREDENALLKANERVNYMLFFLGIIAIVGSAALIIMTWYLNKDPEGYYDTNYYWRLTSDDKVAVALRVCAVMFLTLFAAVCISAKLTIRKIASAGAVYGISAAVCAIGILMNFFGNKGYEKFEEYYKSRYFLRQTESDDYILYVGDYFAYEDFFGYVFLFSLIVVTAVFVISLIVLFIISPGRKGKRVDSAKLKKITNVLLIVTAGAAVCMIVAPITAYLNTREFGYEKDGNSYYISAYYGKEKDLTIPKTHNNKSISGIREGVFKDNDLSSIRILGEYFTIEKNTFSNCKDLTEFIYTGSQRLIIEEDAFKDCTNLNTIHFTNAPYVNAGFGAFENCISLNRVIRSGKTFTSAKDILNDIDGWDYKWFRGTDSFINCPNF